MSLKVLVFESDPAFAGELRTELSRLGLDVRIVDDGNAGLVAAVSERPDLVLLSIELPRMNGFSVCNKLKKDPSLKDVPLIIMSSESSDETFEQHKKLRTRAEDYVHKPIAFGELLEHIRPFVQLEEPEQASGHLDDGIVIDDDIELEEVEEDDFLEPNVSVGVDAEVEAFADSAFDHLLDESRGAPADATRVPSLAPAASYEQPGAPAGGGFDGNGGFEPAGGFERAPSFAPAPAVDMSAVDDGSHDYELTTTFERPRSFAPAGSVAPTNGERSASFAPAAHFEPPKFEPAMFESAFSGPDGNASTKARTSSHPAHPFFDPETDRLRKDLAQKAAEVARLEHELTVARDQVQRLELVAVDDSGSSAELSRLQRELDELRLKTAAPVKAGGVSSRDFLDLREALNKKDKEILGLRDQISRKEKELLDASDTGLGLEREKADLDDKVALLERDVQSARGAADSARADKEQAAKRAEDWRARSEKLKAELEAKHAELASLQARQDGEIAQREARIREREAALTERDERIASLTEQYRVDVAAVEERSRGVLDEAQRAAEEHLRATVLELTQLNDARAAHLERSHADADARWREELGNVRREAEGDRERFQQREQDLESQRAHELDALRAELDRRREADVASVEHKAAEERASTEARHGNERRDLLAQFADASSDLAKRTEEREALAQEVSELRRSLAVSEAAAREAESELAKLREQVGAASRKLDLAGSRWEQNRSSLERAKDALAAAVVQIEEAEARGLE